MDSRRERPDSHAETGPVGPQTVASEIRLLWGVGGVVVLMLVLLLAGAWRVGVASGDNPARGERAKSTGGDTAGTAAATPGPAGRTIDVGHHRTSGGSDATAITAAMASAHPGDTVYFPGGTYHLDEPIHFASNVTVVGDPADPPVLMGEGPVSLLIRHTRERPLRNVTIRGLRFDNIELSLQGDASYSSVVDVTLRDCVFTNGRRAKPWTSDYLWLSYTVGVTVDGCTFLRDRDSGGRGVLLERTRGSVVKDSYFGTTRDLEAGAPNGYFKTAINLLGYDAVSGDRNEDVVIDGNIVRRTTPLPCPRGIACEDHGVYVWGARNVFIRGNYGSGWTSSSTGGILKLRNSELVTVIGNHFLGSGVLAYNYWHSVPQHLRGVQIEGNRIDMVGTDAPGIFYRRVDARGSSASAICKAPGGERDIDIANNTLTDGGRIDVRCAAGRQICVAGNIGGRLALHVAGVRTSNCAGGRSTPFGGIHRGDFNGDGREDFLRPAPGAAGSVAWRAHLSAGDGFVMRRWGTSRDFTPDAARYGLLVGDFNGDQQDDIAYRGRCVISVTGCWSLQHSTARGLSSPQSHGDALVATAETWRYGFHTADFTGDARDDIAFRGACGTDRHPCWVVVTGLDKPHATVSDWGDGAYWDTSATGTFPLLVGDYNGDGRRDIAYRGRCGPTVACLRVHVSTGAAFVAEDWGRDFYADPRMTPHFGVFVGDTNGDGRDDLAYQGRCGDSPTPTWRAHLGRFDGRFAVTCSASRRSSS